MAVQVQYFTDPACSWSWATEPTVRKLMVEFGEGLSWRYVMGGLARDYTAGHEDPEAGIPPGAGVYSGLVSHWLDVAARSRMPLDPRLWSEGPIGSTYPACMAVKAAAEQADDRGYAYLRRLREGLLCFRRKLDTTEALVEEARGARLDVERFRVDLGSHARAAVYGHAPYEAYRAAAEECGAVASDAPAPSVEDALRRFGRIATREVEVVCELPEPRAAAELWSLAAEWKVKPIRVLTGHLWEPA